MTALTPGKNMPSTDLVMTPEYLAKKIIEHFPLEGKVLDPCRGTGAFYNNYPETVEKSWCEIREEKGFFSEHNSVDWIVSNPPWSKMRNFISHAMRLAPNIVFLATITHFVTKARLRDIHKAGYGIREFYCVDTPPNPWPQNGFQLAAVHIQKDYTGSIIMSGRVGY